MPTLSGFRSRCPSKRQRAKIKKHTSFGDHRLWDGHRWTCDTQQLVGNGGILRSVCVRRLRVSHPSPGKHMTRLMKLKKIQIFQVRMRFFKAGTPQGSVPKYKNRCNVKRLGCLASVLSSLVFFFSLSLVVGFWFSRAKRQRSRARVERQREHRWNNRTRGRLWLPCVVYWAQRGLEWRSECERMYYQLNSRAKNQMRGCTYGIPRPLTFLLRAF